VHWNQTLTHRTPWLDGTSDSKEEIRKEYVEEEGKGELTGSGWLGTHWLGSKRDAVAASVRSSSKSGRVFPQAAVGESHGRAALVVPAAPANRSSRGPPWLGRTRPGARAWPAWHIHVAQEEEEGRCGTGGGETRQWRPCVPRGRRDWCGRRRWGKERGLRRRWPAGGTGGGVGRRGWVAMAAQRLGMMMKGWDATVWTFGVILVVY
jgi:hypothetical protein